MSSSTESGPILTTGGFGNILQGSAGSYVAICGQKTAIAQATATKIFTVTIPNGNYSAGGRILCSSTTTASGHIADSTRIVEYLWTVTRTSGAVAVITIALASATSTQIATSGAGGAYTLTSTLGASSVSGGATALNTFDIQVTNTGSTSSTSASTWMAECLNYAGVYPAGALSVAAPGVTIA